MKRLLFLLVALFALIVPGKADTCRVLIVGNSLSYDATMQEFVPIIQSMGDDLVLGLPYKGGQSLQDHWNNISGNVQIYNYHEYSGGKWTTTGSASRTFSPEIIAKYPWDVVILQPSSIEAGQYSTYFPYADDIISYIKQHLTNPDAKFYIYMPWAYEGGSSYMVSAMNSGTYSSQMDMYEHNVDCAFRAAEAIGYPELVIPGGTAVQNGRTSYIGDHYTRDGRHMDLAHGRYTVSLTWYEVLYGKSALDVPYKPATISDFCADMCRHAAHAAVLNPRAVTSLADEFGTAPEIVIPPLEPSLEDPWDGFSKGEPAVDGAGNYVVRSGAELAWIADHVNQGGACLGIIIDNDIDLNNKPWTPIGYGKYFNGCIYGNGHTIRNFYLNRTDLTEKDYFGGLIGGTNSRACDITDLTLCGTIEVPATVTVKANIGAFIGKANALGTMRNCHSEVNFLIAGTPGYVGGLLGFMKNADIKSCSYSGTISITGKVTNGVGGLLGCTNSSVESVEAVIRGCWFSGSIVNNGPGKPKYVAAFNAYSNVSKASESIYNNFATGHIDVTATNMGSAYGTSNTMNFYAANNYTISTLGVGVKGSVVCEPDAFTCGEVAWRLNDDEPLFGQDLSRDNSYPEVFNGDNQVFRTIFMVDDQEYAVLYSNKEMRFPEPPEIPAGFGGWFDDNENKYEPGAIIQSDLVLHAGELSAIDSVDVYADSAAPVCFDMLGRRASASAKGLLIERNGTDVRIVIKK